MANENVIRHDVIQIDIDTDSKGLESVLKMLDEMREQLTGGVDDGLDNLKKSVKGAGNEDGIEQLANDAKKLTQNAGEAQKAVKKTANTDTSKLRSGLQKIGNQLSTIGKKAAGAAYAGLKKVAGISFKALAAGLTGAATAVAALVGKSVSAYADYEQYIGGVETLFKDNAGTVQKYANDAYKTAGLSANEYMDTVTSFSASLISSLGGDTEKAANYAHTAIVDMSDNANKMGTNIGSIQDAYQGFAKQNYTMLDNLKLGYGGTQQEMKRLVKDASKIDKSVKSNSLSFDNIVKAIHAVQENMDITGTTAKEADQTISGSLASLKSAWNNLLPALIEGGDSFDQCVDNLVESALTFKDNIMPAVEKALSGLGTLIEKLAPTIEKHFPVLVDELLPPLIKAATALLKGLIKALPSIIKTIIKELPDVIKQLGQAIAEAFGTEFPALDKIGGAIADKASAIAKFIPYLIGFIALFKIIRKVSGLFGSVSGGEVGGNGGGLTGVFEGLAKTNTKTILKGIANLTIILASLTALTAIMMALAPKIAKLGDMKSLAKVVAVITILGVVGAALAWLGGKVGNIPVSKVALGLANMAIMLVGLGALTAVFLWLTPKIAQMGDLKSILKVSAVMLALAVVGTALSAFAGVAGLIPIPVVLAGLANMAIVFVGIGALTAAFMWLAPKMSELGDIKSILKVAEIMVILGAVGTALTVFAGIAGMIPIPVVLAGLANIALVLGGVTALIVAYGALAQIPGFSDFISTGGEMLAKVFNVIGKCVGSIVGGLGEGITESLPKIGENLSAFAKSLEPLFTVFAGVDMSGVGSFFSSFGSFMLKMAGNDILSFFTGGTDLGALGTELSAFADGSADFFNKVAEIPENGFKNGKLLFDTLAGMKSLPKEGGVVGWFKGDMNYENIASGLNQLSSEKVIGFFNAVAGIKEQGFTNATTLFNTLAGLKKLPKEGGVVGWFSGGVDYTNLATGLGQLSSEKVVGFFQMVSQFDKTTFTNTTALFKALANIDSLPKSGGLLSWANGDTKLADIADDLKYFAETATDFFTQVNKLKVGNLNALWKSLNKSEDVTKHVSEVLDDKISDIVKKISDLPVKMSEGLEKSGSSLAESLAKIWKDAVIASVTPVNKVISGANWILKQFGSEKKVVPWQPYAKGTNGHKGGNALVNDGNGAELVQMPNGKAFIPSGRNVFLPNAPKGMKVLTAEQTAKLMGRNSPTFRYAKGTDDIDIWEYADNSKGLINTVMKKFVDYSGVSGYAKDMSKGMVSTVSGEMPKWADKLVEEVGSLANYSPSGGVKQWKSTVIRALKMEGQYNAANVAKTLYQMQTESGGNPRAINLWDSNAKKGTPSKGLMQVIDPTFKSYARAGFNKNVYDPLSNILASIRYAKSRYGSLARAYQGHGYANGGLVTKPGWIGEGNKKEMVIPLSASKRQRAFSLWEQTGSMLGVSYTPESDRTVRGGNIEYNTYSPSFELTISGTNDDRTMARKVKRWVSEAMNEAFDSMERKSTRLQEV